MSARHIVPLDMTFTSEVSRMTALRMTAAQIAGVLRCKPARVDWARRKLGLASQAGPHQKHMGTPFHCVGTASGEALGAVWRCLEPTGLAVAWQFHDDPRAARPEGRWHPAVVLP